MDNGRYFIQIKIESRSQPEWLFLIYGEKLK